MKKAKALAALLVSCLAGLAQADTTASIYSNFYGTISGWNPVDDDNDPDNGPYYPEPYIFGYGAYVANLSWPGHTVYDYREEEYGWGVYEDGYGMVASMGVNGGYLNSSISFPSTTTGSAQTWGSGITTYTLLPGTTVTFSGYWGVSWNSEHNDLSGTYFLSLQTWEEPYPTDATPATLLSMEGSFNSLGGDGLYREAEFSFTNNFDVAIQRSFLLGGALSLQAVYIPPAVTPVPEPHTYAMMLAGLAAVGFVGRRRVRAELS